MQFLCSSALCCIHLLQQSQLLQILWSQLEAVHADLSTCVPQAAYDIFQFPEEHGTDKLRLSKQGGGGGGVSNESDLPTERSMVLLATTEKGGTMCAAPASTRASRVNWCTIGLPISLLACTHAQTPHAQPLHFKGSNTQSCCSLCACLLPSTLNMTLTPMCFIVCALLTKVFCSQAGEQWQQCKAMLVVHQSASYRHRSCQAMLLMCLHQHA